MWFNKSSSSGESEINTPVNVGGSAEFRDSVQERPVRHSRHNSFQMEEDDALGEMEQEQPSKVRSMMWSRPVVDGKELETRLQSYRVRDLELEVSDPEKRARVDPESDRYMAWLFFIVFLCALSVSSTGYYQCFYEEFSKFHGYFVVEWLVDAVFMFNMVIHFNVGYVNGEGTKVMNLQLIRPRYLVSLDFGYDLLSCLPLDLVQLGLGWSPALRLNKLARLWTMRGYLRRLQDTSESPSTINYIVITRLILIWLLLPNLFTVLRILLIREGADDDEWKFRERNLDPTQNHTSLYLRSLHWCMGVMSGYSDGTIPESGLQYLFTLGVLNIGLFTFAYTVGVIGAIGDANSQRSHDLQISVTAMQHFVHRYHIPYAFIKRITDYLAHRWELIRSNEKELVTAAELLEELPPCVRYDAVECMTADALNKVPLFARVEEGFVHALTQKMEPVNTSVGETLVRQGEVCDGLYIVLKGSLEVTVHGSRVAEIGKGSCIGEQSMLTGNPAGATVTSLSFCELYRLRREPFEELSYKFTETFEGFKQAAKLEAKNAKKAAKAKKGMGKKGMGGGDADDSSFKQAGGVDLEAGLGGGGGFLSLLRSPRRLLAYLTPILPHSKARAVWAGFLLLTLAYETLALPFKLVFVGNYIDGGLTALDILADLVLVLDVLGRRYLAYTEDGRLITDLGKIRKRLMRRRTLVPLLCSAFPCSVLLPLWPLVDARFIQLLRITRALRLVPYLLYKDAIQNQQPSNLEELLRTMRTSAFDLQFALTKLAPLLTMYIVCVHYVACGYWAVVHVVVPPDHATLSGISGGPGWANQSSASIMALMNGSMWLPDAQYLIRGDMLRFYFRAFYFATCNLTGLGAALVPFAVPSVLFTLGCFIIGVMVFAYLTSAIVTLVMHADAAAVSYKQKSLQLLGFMQDAGIESSVIHRASKWLMQWWHAHGGVNLDSIIRELPPSLALEVKMHVFHECTRKCTFWAPSRSGEILSAKELYKLAQDFNFEVFNNNEWVLRKGMLNDKFFIVAFGVLQIILDDGTAHVAGRRRMSAQSTSLRNAVVAELGKGECVGEHSAILKGKCEASVRAKGSVELLVIPRESMLRLTQRNPLVKHRLHVLMNTRFAENLYLTTGKVSMNAAATAVRCMRKLVAFWRARKAERAALASANPGAVAAAPAVASTKLADAADGTQERPASKGSKSVDGDANDSLAA